MHKEKAYKGETGVNRLGLLTLDFFNFYFQFRFESDVISVRAGCVLSQFNCARYSDDLVRGDYRQWYDKSFLIEEHFHRGNVARSELKFFFNF